VACHIRDSHKGGGIKASDHSIAFGCAACHRFLDEGFVRHHMSSDDLAPFEKRGLQETWAILIRDGIVGFPHNVERMSADKPTPARKPKADRTPIAHRKQPIPAHVGGIPSRPFQKKAKA
jgi:hypothetical protein